MAHTKRKTRSQSSRAAAVGIGSRDVHDDDSGASGDDVGLKNDHDSMNELDGADAEGADKHTTIGVGKRIAVAFVSNFMIFFLVTLVGVLASLAVLQHHQRQQQRHDQQGFKRASSSQSDVCVSVTRPFTVSNIATISNTTNIDIVSTTADDGASMAAPKHWLIDSFPFHHARTSMLPFTHPLQPEWLAQYDSFFDLVGQVDAAVEVASTDPVGAAAFVPPESVALRIQTLYSMVVQEYDQYEYSCSGIDANCTEIFPFCPVAFTAAEVTSLLDTTGAGLPEEVQQDSVEYLEAQYSNTTMKAHVQQSIGMIKNLEAMLSFLGLNEISVSRLLSLSDAESKSPETSPDDEFSIELTKRLKLFDASTICDINGVLTHEVLHNATDSSSNLKYYRSYDMPPFVSNGQQVTVAPNGDIAFAMERFSQWLQTELRTVLLSSQYHSMVRRWKDLLEAVLDGETVHFDQEMYENSMNVTNQVVAIAADSYARMMHISPFPHPTNKMTAVIVAGMVLHECIGLPLIPLISDSNNSLLLGALARLQYTEFYRGFVSAVHASIEGILGSYVEFAFTYEGNHQEQSHGRGDNMGSSVTDTNKDADMPADVDTFMEEEVNMEQGADGDVVWDQDQDQLQDHQGQDQIEYDDYTIDHRDTVDEEYQ